MQCSSVCAQERYTNYGPRGNAHVIGRNRVVITGIGVLAANGIGKEAFWKSLLAGESGIGPITHFDTSDIPWKLAGEISDFKATDYIPPKFKLKRESRGTQLVAVAAQMAYADAQFTKEILLDTAPVLVTIGTTLGGLDLVEIHDRKIEKNGLKRGLLSVSCCLHIKGPSVISSMLDVPTKVGALSNSCTGGLDAIASAYKTIKSGEAEVAFAGGTDAVIIPSVITGLGYAGLLSTDEGRPESASRPFDQKRTGGFLGEGAGVVVLENLEHALARGATPYAEIVGFDSTCDYTDTLNLGFEKSMQGALQNAGYMPSDISYINAHGSSDPALDLMEAASISKVFEDIANIIPITSIKGVTGNPLAAAGAIQAISACQSFRRKIIPPIANLTHPDPICDLDFVMGDARNHFQETCMINSRGIGGVNSSLILRNFP